jgi:hemolysin D
MSPLKHFSKKRPKSSAKVIPLRKRSNTNDAYEFQPLLIEIEDDPGSPLGNLTFWLVIAVFSFFVLWAIFGQVDIVVSARGKVIPAGEVKTVQPLSGGIISKILVKPGDFVKKGQTLLVIDPSTTAPSLASNQKTLAHVQMEQARLQASANDRDFQSSENSTQGQLYRASILALQKQISAKQKQFSNLDAQISAKQVEVKQSQESLSIHLEKEKRVQEVKDIVTKDDVEKAHTDVLTDQNKLKSLVFELEQLAFQKQQTNEEISYLSENFKSTTLNDLSDKEKQVNQLTANIEEATFKNTQQTLTAPVTGYVHELFVHTLGGVVTPAQKILSIVPLNAPLRVRAVLANKDVGFVHAGMPVALKIDTFDFQKYGTLQGKVIQVSRDSKDDPKQGPIYTLDVEPVQQQLKVNGEWRKLSTGLSLNAEVKTGKRRIIEFFIYPLIKHLNEGMSVR